MDLDVSNPCLCCLVRQSDKDLKVSNTWLDKTEVYMDMLKDCFEINIQCDDSASGICEVCVARLRDAAEFKQQVVECQRNMMAKQTTTIKEEIRIKDEIGEDDTDDRFEDNDRDDDDDVDYDNYIPDLQEEKDVLKSPKEESSDSVVVTAEIVPIKESRTTTAKVKNKLPAKQTVGKLVRKASQSKAPPLKYVKLQSNIGKAKANQADKEIVKKITQRFVQKVLADRKKKVECMAAKKESFLKKSSGPVSDQRAGPGKVRSLQSIKIANVTNKKSPSLPENATVLRRKHKSNFNILFKYSNVIPFGSKSLSGYNCAFCKETFPDPKDLRVHTESHRSDEFLKRSIDVNNLAIKMDITDLACTICEEQAKDIKTLKTHLLTKHDKKFHMDIKDFVFEFKLRQNGKHDCALCNSTFETFKMLLQHMNNHYRNYICDTCGMGFINMTKLKTHTACHETGEFVCQLCSKVFPTLTKKAYHEKFTHSRVRYSTNCPHCEETFQSYYKRNQHMVTVHNSNAASYKCNICDRSFLLKAQLTNHTKKIHLMERNHICTECGEGFYQKQYLKEHMIRHNGERIFKCEICHRAYARKKTLREHMRIHNNDRRHKCHVCSLAFVQKCSLKSHLLSNHGIHMKTES